MLTSSFLFCSLLFLGARFSQGKVLKGPVDMKAGTFLSIEGTTFKYGPDSVYLSGTNPAWINYGNDFGNAVWDGGLGDQWRDTIRTIGGAGGNLVRIWVHVEGAYNPEFDAATGNVLSTDASGSLIRDLRSLLDVCQESGVFANLVLWNGAEMREENYRNLFFSDSKLQSYIDNALIPMVEDLKDHPALGAWEVINEPEGSAITNESNPDQPCFDLGHLEWTKKSNSRAPGWTDGNIPMENLLRFINWQASIIHSSDPKALVSTGSWSPWSQCNPGVFDEDATHKACFNHYSSECLVQAGGKSDGTMDFWQIHDYPYEGVWQGGAPWSGLEAAQYGFGEPLVIGEFPTEVWEVQNTGAGLPGGETTEDLVEYLYTNGFGGGWSWNFGLEHSAEQDEDCLDGLRQLEGRTENGIVDVEIV